MKLTIRGFVLVVVIMITMAVVTVNENFGTIIGSVIEYSMETKEEQNEK